VIEGIRKRLVNLAVTAKWRRYAWPQEGMKMGSERGRFGETSQGRKCFGPYGLCATVFKGRYRIIGIL